MGGLGRGGKGGDGGADFFNTPNRDVGGGGGGGGRGGEFDGVGDIIVSRHEERDAFYVVEEGELDVIVSGNVALTLRRVSEVPPFIYSIHPIIYTQIFFFFVFFAPMIK